MIVFLIILAVFAVIIAAILSVSATFTVIYDGNWSTRVKVLWIEKDIILTKILSFILFPEKSADDVKKKRKNKAKEKSSDNSSGNEAESHSEKAENASDNKAPQKPKKQNYFKTIMNDDGIVGIMLFASNLFQTASNAIGTLFKGFHIHSLYVKILIGGGDAADIAQAYGTACKYYYPLKGAILGGMKVDNYDDWVAPDFIEPRSEYGLQFIGSVSVAVLLKVLLSAGKTFLLNLIKNK
ncbi:MAG: hypothetical protein K2G22_05310 [Eubacterium sp.]|nr:hypothetical protein [Eubacterium sp.]